MKESLEMYRNERRSFVLGLKYYFGIDFYKLDKSERKEWLKTYIESKREFLTNLIQFWEDTHVDLDSFCREKKYSLKNMKSKKNKMKKDELEEF